MKCNKKNRVYWTERLKEHLQLPKNIDNTTLTHNVKKETSIEFKRDLKALNHDNIRHYTTVPLIKAKLSERVLF